MDLNQLKSHPYYPFRNFRDDDLSFLLLELYWAELFRTATAGAADAATWVPQSPADREDGNPILHLISRRAAPARSLRIVQRFNTEALPELDLATMAPVHFTHDAYVPFVPDLGRQALDADGATPIEELLISADVSADCERLCIEWIRRWCVEYAAPSLMQEALDRYWAAVRQSLVQAPDPDLA